MVTPGAKGAWSTAMILAAKADIREFIDVVPVCFKVIEKTKVYTTYLLVQLMTTHYRFDNSRLY